MNIQQKVSLRGMRFHAFHGYYPEEQLTGSEFLVDVEVSFEAPGSDDHTLSATVNYELLQQLVTEQMKRPRKLIETIAHEILQETQVKFPDLDAIVVRIRKMHPPLSTEVDHAEIELTYTK